MSNMQTSLPSVGGLALQNVIFTDAAGGRCVDTSGKNWLDFVSGYGSVVLGHAHPAVAERVASAVRRGTYFYGRHPEIIRLRKRLLALYPNTIQAFFFKTGSEAVQSATRLVRSSTGRSIVLRCGFHGWHDEFMADDISWHRYHVDVTRIERTAGVPSVVHQISRAVPANAAVVDRVMAENDDVAALILDPVQLQEPIGDMLNELRQVCESHGALLIVDESKTCLRTGPSGIQGRYGVFGDVTILSKAIANGFPLAAVLFNERSGRRADDARIMGTFNDEYSAIAAAHATLDVSMSINLCERLEEIGQELIDTVNAAVLSINRDSAIVAIPYRWPSMPFFLSMAHFNGHTNVTAQIAQFLATRQILWLPNHMNFVNLQHSKNDCQTLAAAVADFFVEGAES